MCRIFLRVIWYIFNLSRPQWSRQKNSLETCCFTSLNWIAMRKRQYQVYDFEMRISNNRWCTRAICAIKNLTLHHFVVSSTNVRRARVINWKSVCIVLCCCVEYVEIYTENRAFADSINFLFWFDQNCCWIIPFTSRSSWWTCSIIRYLWTMVSAFQK